MENLGSLCRFSGGTVPILKANRTFKLTWSCTIVAGVLLGLSRRANSQTPASVFAPAEQLLFELSRTIIPPGISSGGNDIAKVLEARYCGADQGAGTFLVSLQRSAQPRPAAPRLLSSDCSAGLPATAKRLSNFHEVDGIMLVRAKWTPWTLQLTYVGAEPVGGQGFDQPTLNILQSYSVSQGTDNQSVVIAAPKQETFSIALAFTTAGIRVCAFDSKPQNPVCDASLLNAPPSSEDTSLTVLLSHGLLSRMVTKYSDSLSFTLISNYIAAIQAYSYDSASGTVRLDGMVTETSTQFQLAVTIDLKDTDMSISNAQVRDRTDQNCQGHTGLDLLGCKARSHALAALLQGVLVSQRQPLHISNLNRPASLKVLQRQLSVRFDSRKLSYDSNFLKAELATVIEAR